MGKKDFDIEFDFEDEYGFDPKAFLGTEEYSSDIDLNAFSDDELGLTSPSASEERQEEAAGEPNDFDLDEDLDLDDFLNMGSEDDDTQQEDPEEEDWSDEDEDSAEDDGEESAEEDFDEDPDLSEDTDPEETDMDETLEYAEDEELQEEERYDEDTAEEEDEETAAPKRKPRQKKERKPIQLPKITLPKLQTPNIFTKFYDLYFAPVLDKNWVNPEDPPQDPNAPRRRRRKTRAQIFKEVYLPPILCCVCLILVMSFLVGSLSNFIEQRRIDKDTEALRKESSINEEELAQQVSLAVAEEAALLAAGYDYEAAIEKLDSLGDLSAYQDLATKRAEYLSAMQSLVEFKDYSMIPNLSFHVLVEDMARALKDTEFGGKYNRNFVTTSEFAKILQQLYDNGYVLVDFDSFVGAKNDVNGNEMFEPVPMWLPADKKPVMITETMVNYFNYMVSGDDDGVADAQGDGFASKLVLDDQGNIKAEYITAEGQTLVGNYDLVPILEDFIAQHPDFSYRGARAIIAVTGHEGLFGYRCNTSYIGNKGQGFYDQEVAGAKQIANALRNKGYTIASYTYDNKNYANYNANNIKTDMQKWGQEVTSVIGEVDTFVFAQQGNLTDYNGTSLDVMMEAGFRFYIANASTATSAVTTINQTYVRQNRLMVTGNSMQWNPNWFTGLFNCSAVLETSIRGDVPN